LNIVVDDIVRVQNTFTFSSVPWLFAFVSEPTINGISISIPAFFLMEISTSVRLSLFDQASTLKNQLDEVQ